MKSRDELQKLCYHKIKDQFGLSAQPAVRVIKKVVDAYTSMYGEYPNGKGSTDRSPGAVSRQT